mgnify:CR=1 FL=1
MTNSNGESLDQIRRREEMNRIRDLARQCRNDGEFFARLWGLDLAMLIDDPEPCEYTEIRFVNPFGLLAGKPSNKNEQGDVE